MKFININTAIIKGLRIIKIPNFFLLRDFLIFKTLFGFLDQKNRIEYLKRKYKASNKSQNLNSKVENFDEEIQDKGIFIFRDIDKSNLRFFRFLNNFNMYLNNSKKLTYKDFKINLFFNLIYKKNIYSNIAASIGIKYIDLICKLIYKKYQLFSLGDCLERKQNYLYKNNFKGYKIIYIPKQKDFKKSKITYINNSHKPSLDRIIYANKLALQSMIVGSSTYKNNKVDIFDNNKIFNSNYLKELRIEENNLVIINDLLLFHVDKKFLSNKYFLISL